MRDLTDGRLRGRGRRACAGWLAALGLIAAYAPAWGGSVLHRVRAAEAVRVCIWPDYYGVTYRDPRTGRLSGIDIDLAGAFARDLGVRLETVDSSFTRLIDDLRAKRCDVAMFAVGVLPQREASLRFTRPYLQSDIYAVTTRSNRVIRRWQDIDQPGVAVGVAAGTFMEPVMKARLRHARLVSVSSPDTRERELQAGRIDVFMTDYPYSRRLLDNADWAVLIEPPAPFHVLPYAYAVRPGDEVWWAEVDRFVARVQADGRLRAAAERHGLLPILRLP
ncbi:MAG: amino acid ABC transporter substrate-binding protein [Rubrivivax sp.]|nr:amino acid ABC transporter substrate-binding protein [Rubrivivax sp.]